MLRNSTSAKAMACAAGIVLFAWGLHARIAAMHPLTSSSSVPYSKETGNLWFVELVSPPASEGTPTSILRQENANFHAAAAAAGLKYRQRYAFDTLWNGLSIEIDPLHLPSLSRIPGVVAIYPVGTSSLPPADRVNEPQLATALAMTGADIAQNSLGLSGRGVKVGIIDSGVDYHHPDLGGCFGPGCRVAAGYDFVGDAYNGRNAPVSDSDPDDCNGHGTHVAGIVGANGVIRGVAPAVSFGAYRIFGCAGSGSDDIMIAAMERALADGMQVVNISAGHSFGWPQQPTAIAATRLVNKGVVVIASIGNDAHLGVYAASAPGVGSKVIGVASFDNSHQSFRSFTVSPDNKPVGYLAAVGAPPAPLSGTYTLARTGTPATPRDACEPLPSGSLAGTVALVRAFGCPPRVKAFNAMAAGAAGVVYYTVTDGISLPYVTGNPPITIPVVSVSRADGLMIDARIGSGVTTMTWTNTAVSTPIETAGLISPFSSYGLAPDLSLTPDIGAPGGFIRSTVPIEQGYYDTWSGTSFAAPHVAGAVALLLEARPHTSPQIVRDILQNSAEPAPWFGDPGLAFLESTHRQGAGMIQIDKAILNHTLALPGKLSLGDIQSEPASATLVITNHGSAAVTYNLTHQPALSTTNAYPPEFTTGFASVGFSPHQVTVQPGLSVAVTLTVTANAELAHQSIFGGYIVLTPMGQGQAVKVPYSGFKGDYQSIPVLTPTEYGFPWLAKLDGSELWEQPDGGTYTLQGDDVPIFVLQLNHYARWLRMEVFDATTGKAWHRAFEFSYVARNDPIHWYYAIPWDGYTTTGTRSLTVPNGRYVMKVTVLKALGDESTPGDTETWTSPVITLARPR